MNYLILCVVRKMGPLFMIHLRYIIFYLIIWKIKCESSVSKKMPWKIQLMKTLKKSHNKLKKYYVKIQSNLNYIYNIIIFWLQNINAIFFEKKLKN
jgi:hypothetical protein